MASAYGKDTSCTTSLRPGRMVSGGRLVAEALYRRLTTPRGMLVGGEQEANYGLDLTEMIGTIESKQQSAALPGLIRAECKKDDRIGDVDVVVTETLLGPAKELNIEITGQTKEGDSFELTLRVDEVSVEILGLGGT